MYKKLVVANWKMNGNIKEAKSRTTDILAKIPSSTNVELVICPPHIQIPDLSSILSNKSSLAIGAQTVSPYLEGAYTGDISLNMLADYPVKYIILGHSERRQYHAESNEDIAKAYANVVEFGMTPILCIGENLQQYEKGQTLKVLSEQLFTVIERVTAEVVSKNVIAYEPIWAIGTGKTPTAEEINSVHQKIREQLAEFGEQATLLYGGSVKPENAPTLAKLEHVDGFLVGGASLKAESFIQICEACI